VSSVGSVEQLEELLALGHESRSFEVKGPGSPGGLKDKAYLGQIAKAVMAMGNLRDGGLVCLGIDEPRMREMRPGLSAEQVAQWSDYDQVHTAMASLVDPPPGFQPLLFRLSSGCDVVVLEVDEFDDVPHLCRADVGDVLQAGAMYVRPRGMPRSVRVPDAREMRDVLDIATDKAVREFLRRAYAAGLPSPGAGPAINADSERFDAERAEAWAAVVSSVLEQVNSSGHTDVAIRPVPFDAERVAPRRLVAFLEQQTVRLRGWPLPYIDSRQPIQRLGTFVGQDIAPTVVPHLESWRMCASGQFLHRRALATDMRDSPLLEATAEGTTGAVALWDIVLYMVELAELAARFAAGLHCDHIDIDIALAGVAGRELIAGDHQDHVRPGLIVHADRLNATRRVDSQTLLANPRRVGVTLAQDLLAQFGLDLPDTALLDLQQRVFGS